MPVSRTAGMAALTAFFVLLIGLPILQSFQISPGIVLFDAFYRSGARWSSAAAMWTCEAW